MVERNDNFRRDFKTADEYHKRLDAEAAERATFEPDLGKVLVDLTIGQAERLGLTEELTA